MNPLHQNRIQETLHNLGKIQPQELAPILAGYYHQYTFTVAQQHLQQLADTVSSISIAVAGFVMDTEWKRREAADANQQQRETGPNGEALLSVLEAAQAMGVSKQKAYSMIKDGKLPAKDLNHGTGKRSCLRINPADLPR